MLSIHLRDINPALVAAWEKQFEGCANVQVSQGPIFDVTADAIVSPANSFGFMDGGIDLAYSEHFGWALPNRLQQVLREHHHGELPVGEALIVWTRHSVIPWMVCAPTMRIPMDVSDTVNPYLAFRATLRAVLKHNQDPSVTPINSILCPGLGTAIGKVPPAVCAKQMYLAYTTVVLNQGIPPVSLGQVVESHYWMTR